MTLTNLPCFAILARLPFHSRRQPSSVEHWPLTLADILPGKQAEVASFLIELSDERQAHLRAYGLSPGSIIQVKQHQPVTVIQVDHTELAMEAALARQVAVRSLP